jgi:hypothetical protein
MHPVGVIVGDHPPERKQRTRGCRFRARSHFLRNVMRVLQLTNVRAMEAKPVVLSCPLQIRGARRQIAPVNAERPHGEGARRCNANPDSRPRRRSCLDIDNRLQDTGGDSRVRTRPGSSAQLTLRMARQTANAWPDDLRRSSGKPPTLGLLILGYQERLGRLTRATRSVAFFGPPVM